MFPNKLTVAAFATLASLIVVDAGPCRPSPSSVVTSSASESASSTFLAETSTGSFTTSVISSVITETGISVTALSSETITSTISTETSTTGSEAATSAAEDTTTTTAEGETSTTAISSETTTAIATTESSTIVPEITTATTTTVEGEPTYLINPNFEDGTTAPWIVTPYPNPFSLSDQSKEGPASGRQLFGPGTGPGSDYKNYFYQELDKKSLRAGRYSLKGYVRVDQIIDDNSNNGCSMIGAHCLAGPADNLNNLPGDSGDAGETGYYLDWYQFDGQCTFTEEVLAQYDQFGVGIGFKCLNTGVNVDAVSFGPI
ncbi:hypothetical protein FVEG_01544 [Fusarium verticillioides 7600]|uniref:Uncharacterized protein n=1 Tax=Gibberella moniliformis (strain M3125 / FGSC 7600) TaxID=334819 RepID=W7LS04_GIBM7|nr:hypothetical protein FVEG_01544 [Fusarium verticillioides 7600]EWG38285.1 hypothetical protein FVEG_01544 [Fusarium verticillioides 7600]